MFTQQMHARAEVHCRVIKPYKTETEQDLNQSAKIKLSLPSTESFTSFKSHF